MKPVTRIHTCIISRGVLDYVIKHGGMPKDGPWHTIEFMEMPPKELLVKARTLEEARPLPDGSIMTRIEVTALEDEA